MAFIIATALGLLYAYWMAHSYVKQGIGYEQQSESMDGIVKSPQEKERKLPPFWTAIATLLILFAFSAIFTFVDAFGFDSTQAVIFAQIIAALWACLINLKFIEKGTILSQLTRGVVNVLPIAILMGFISGFGAVVQTTSAFGSLLSRSAFPKYKSVFTDFYRNCDYVGMSGEWNKCNGYGVKCTVSCDYNIRCEL